MKAVDTNVLLRYVLRDDEGQFAKAAAFFVPARRRIPPL